VPARVGQSPCGIEMSLKKITCRIYLIGLFIFFLADYSFSPAPAHFFAGSMGPFVSKNKRR
jgi:hypothetical protein